MAACPAPTAATPPRFGSPSCGAAARGRSGQPPRSCPAPCHGTAPGPSSGSGRRIRAAPARPSPPPSRCAGPARTSSRSAAPAPGCRRRRTPTPLRATHRFLRRLHGLHQPAARADLDQVAELRGMLWQGLGVRHGRALLAVGGVPGTDKVRREVRVAKAGRHLGRLDGCPRRRLHFTTCATRKLISAISKAKERTPKTTTA